MTNILTKLHTVPLGEYLGAFSLPCDFDSALETLWSINTNNKSVAIQEQFVSLLFCVASVIHGLHWPMQGRMDAIGI
jgi:hypothetical protein